MPQLMKPYGIGVTLYSFLNRTDTRSPYYIIAKFILKNMDNIKNISIKGLSEKTNVSTATISRFCKEIGLNTFAELREMINDSDSATEPNYDFSSINTEGPVLHRYIDSVIQNINNFKQFIDMSILEKLVQDIHKYENVVTFGAMHMETVALLLQNNFFRCKKIIDTRLDPRKQVEFIQECGEDSLIIIFSISGNYVREYLSNIIPSIEKKRPKIYVVTINSEVKKLNYVDEVILLPDDSNNFSSHPIDSILLVNIITLIYHEYYVE
ncbi:MULTISPECIES: MurR/RpiR family transcriptional regulator [Bacillus cereus group]|uniref:MurR/RpiR family transcriptional regulator n=1 Tax=Bacillus cereus group TaxID=86661 RepID=UPI001AEE6E4D|nr:MULTISPECIES: MurR/RpiR family transcriptional regulator [Bacillus cereus group]MDH2882610.1 MurR/RpiR family transcriptional regulator [Bacillus cytotoxicus]QTR78545.1 MurR/RpiR family transcriptional regulator [Bacillus cytotoxicus]